MSRTGGAFCAASQPAPRRTIPTRHVMASVSPMAPTRGSVGLAGGYEGPNPSPDQRAEKKCGTQAKPPAPPTASHLHALVGRASACQRPLAGAFFLSFSRSGLGLGVHPLEASAGQAH